MISTAVVNHVFYIQISVTNIYFTPSLPYTIVIHCISPAFAATLNKPLFIYNYCTILYTCTAEL